MKAFKTVMFIFVVLSLSSTWGCGPLVGIYMNLTSETVPHPIEHTEAYRQYNSFQKDFAYFAAVLADAHPDVTHQLQKEAFETERDTALSELEDVTDQMQFELILTSFITRIGDSHTQILRPSYKSKKRFLVKFRWFGDALYLTDVGESLNPEWIGAEVLSIGKRPLEEVLGILSDSIPSENAIWRRRRAAASLSDSLFLKALGIASPSETLDLRIRTRAGVELVLTLSPRKRIKWLNQVPAHPVMGPTGKFFSYKIIPEYKLCYFQFNYFLDAQIASHMNMFLRLPFRLFLAYKGAVDFRGFLDEMFDAMRNENVRTFIIDVRNNSGGYGPMAKQLLYHLDTGKRKDLKDFTNAVKISELYRLHEPDEVEEILQMEENKEKSLPFLHHQTVVGARTDGEDFFDSIADKENVSFMEEPKEKFAGKVYLLIGPGTYSSAGMLTGFMIDNGLGTVVGEPTGQKPDAFGDMLFLKLPNTSIHLSLSYKAFYRPDRTKRDEPSFFPDVAVPTTIDDFFEGRDPVYDWVIQEIDKDEI